MRDYRIGRLKKRFVVTFTDKGDTRRRYRLSTVTAKAAEREARDLMMEARAPLAGITVQQVWGAGRPTRCARWAGRCCPPSGTCPSRRSPRGTAENMRPSGRLRGARTAPSGRI